MLLTIHIFKGHDLQKKSFVLYTYLDNNTVI